MANSLVKHERIMTTTAKAKDLRRVVERLITHAKMNNQKHKALAGAVLTERAMMVKLFEILGPRYK